MQNALKMGTVYTKFHRSHLEWMELCARDPRKTFDMNSLCEGIINV